MRIFHGISLVAVFLLLTACNYAGEKAGNQLSVSIPGKISKAGFSVEVYPADRPFWEILAEDLDGDGNPEIIASDVDGLVTVRNAGSPVSLSWAAGALIYQFAAADLNNDGIKEIIMSSVDPTIPVKALDLHGNIVQVFSQSSGPERIAAGDMDVDGNAELAVTIENLKENSGTASGVRLYDNKGKVLWTKEETLRDLQIGDIHSEKGLELVTGEARVNFNIYSKSGKLLEKVKGSRNLLYNFILNDIDGDGSLNIIALHEAGSKSEVSEIICLQDTMVLWNVKSPSQLKEDAWDYSAIQSVIACGDFDKKSDGNETVMIGTNYVFLFDSHGKLLYQNREGYKEYWGSWVPEGINPMDFSVWNTKNPRLFISSSRYRHRAFYEISYGEEEEFSTYLLPDQEAGLDKIYQSLSKQEIRKPLTDQKVKIFLEMNPLLEYTFSEAPEETLSEYRKMLDALESPGLEYLVNWDPNTPMPRHFRYQLTDDQIVERARLFEKTGIPFGYWISHGRRIWMSDDVIRRSKEAAPTMFRFICAVENLETFYSRGYADWMKWVEKTLKFCSEHQMKMIFKDKQDIWALLPADTAFANIMFNPDYKDVVVPSFSTNQPFNFETQLSGLLGLKLAGLCTEWGISSQYWNWHEWGGYPRGIRDISPTTVCPSDIILRLDLMAVALGATWLNLEHGQPYFREDMKDGLVPMAYRHREIVFELIRKNLLIPGAFPVNINNTAIIRSLHPDIIKAKEESKNVLYPYYARNTESLRKGFMPARYMFENYPSSSFPYIAYSSAWNGADCFPATPFGWVPVVPPQAALPGDHTFIATDGEYILKGQEKKEAEGAASDIRKMFVEGADGIPFEAAGSCMIIQKAISGDKDYTVILLDPGYLAPTGIETILKSLRGDIRKVTDAITGEDVLFSRNACPVVIQPGAFRIMKIELN